MVSAHRYLDHFLLILTRGAVLQASAPHNGDTTEQPDVPDAECQLNQNGDTSEQPAASDAEVDGAMWCDDFFMDVLHLRNIS